MALTTVNLTPRVGSELKIDVDTLVSGAVSDEIRELLVQRGVLIVRDANLTEDQQRAFTRTLGDLRLGAVTKEGEEGLMKISMDKKENAAYAEFFPGTFFWHMDGTYEQVPPFATVLTPRVLSPEGGQTEFANNYAAYEDLPESDKALIENLRVVHTMQSAMLKGVPDATVEDFKLWRSYPAPSHPLVWHHKSGRKSLVLSASASYIPGLHPAESLALIQRLTSWATQDKYVYRHEWRMGDLLIWDNTGTMHRALPYDPNCGRLLHRFTLNGEEPIAAAA